MKPLPSARHVVAPCLALLAAATGALAATAPTEPAPPPPAESGWVSRLASAPRKLAFWKKDDAPAPTPVAAGPTSSNSASSNSAAPKTTKATKATASMPKPADDAASPGPSPASTEAAVQDKRGFFSRLPSLPNPFAKKTGPEPVEVAPKLEKPATEPAQAAAKKSKPAGQPAAEATVAAEEPKKPGFLRRVWPGGDKPEAGGPASDARKEVSVASSAAREKTGNSDADGPTKEKLGPVKPEPSKKLAATKAKTDPAPAPPEKRSLWSRVASAVVPGKAATPAPTTAVPARGSRQTAALDPTTSTFVITKDESPFYTFGPQQATAPDAYLSTGTLVTLHEKSWGWAQIQLPDGRTGTIARNALRPATVADLVPTAAAPSLMAATNSHRGSSSSAYVMPPAAMPDLPTGPASPDSAAEAEELSSALLPPFAE